MTSERTRLSVYSRISMTNETFLGVAVELEGSEWLEQHLFYCPVRKTDIMHIMSILSTYIQTTNFLSGKQTH
uniref:Uncharacterized protein n=1 Tax=Anguilla anguilla TaxID=7936 RepID=A0A0E9X8Z5_ANGAN